MQLISTNRTDNRQRTRGHDTASRVHSWAAISEAFQPRGGLALQKPCFLQFIRHAETTYNKQGLVSGQVDIPLTDNGILQAKEIGAELMPSYDFIYCSTLSRAKKTMQIAMGNRLRAAQSVRFDARINERSLGDLEGTRQSYVAAFARGDLDYAPTGGESYRTLIQRCLSFLIDVRAELSSQGEAATVAVFTHMGPMRVFSALFKNIHAPKEMMALNFQNIHILGYEWTNLSFPEAWAPDGHP